MLACLTSVTLLLHFGWLVLGCFLLELFDLVLERAREGVPRHLIAPLVGLPRKVFSDWCDAASLDVLDGVENEDTRRYLELLRVEAEWEWAQYQRVLKTTDAKFLLEVLSRRNPHQHGPIGTGLRADQAEDFVPGGPMASLMRGMAVEVRDYSDDWDDGGDSEVMERGAVDEV